MYYRRKIILAILEKFGGEIKPTHFQKLLLLFTRQQKKAAFEFIPHKYGAFSAQARADKKTMIKYDLLEHDRNWVLASDEGYINQLKKTDRQILENLYKQFKDSSTDELIHFTYLEHPFFATRSEIAGKLLTEEELKRVKMFQPVNEDRKLYTIGYEGIPVEEYMNRLYKKNVQVLVDVRKNSLSMKFGFSKSQLREMCQKMEIQFIHIPELGIESNKRKNLETPADYEELFEEYETATLPHRKEHLERLKKLFEEYNRIAITCFEKEHTSCHRHKISDYLQKEYEVPIEHL